MEKNDFLSDYEIKDTIGNGTFSVVKLGINNLSKEKVAIKIMKKKKMQTEEHKLRLEREISILKELHHINIIKIHKIIKEQDNYYIVMEYCEEGELFNYIITHQKLSEKETAYFFYQLINGLDYLHHKNIVHRDLKPENLLLTQGNILKIIDFGLGNYYDPEGKLLSTPCGSPSYASPEMIKGNHYSGCKIDIWCCGIITYAMICGYLPFEAQSNMLLFKKITECQVEFPEFLSDDSIDIMSRMIVLEPDERISIEQIKRHPFYLKGKKEFEKKHKDLIEQVECIVDKINDNSIEDDTAFSKKNNNANNNELSIKKSKSSNILKDEKIELNDNKNDLYLFQIKDRLKKFKLQKKILKKDNINNIVKYKDNINIMNNEKLKEALSKKFKINNDININKVISNKKKVKEIDNQTEEINNNSFKDLEKNVFEQKMNKNNIHSDVYNVSGLTSIYAPHSDDFRMKFSEINTKKKKIFYPNSRNKDRINFINQLLNKEKFEKYFDEKKLILQRTQKNKESLSYLLLSPKNKISEKLLQNTMEYKKPASNKVQKQLEFLKHGVSNKNIDDLLLYNKNIKSKYEPNAKKNISAIDDKNIHIKHLRILSNNNYIGNIENINNVKNINNIIVYNNPNSSKISIIKDVQYLTNMNKRKNYDLPNINNKIVKENKALNTKNIKLSKLNKTKNIYTKRNNLLIPKIILSKENSNTSISNNYNTSNINEFYFNSIDKKLNEIKKKFNKKNSQKLFNKYKDSSSSIDNIIKNSKLNKKLISERNNNSKGFANEINYNNTFSKINKSIYSIKNKSNLNRVKHYHIFNFNSKTEKIINMKKLNNTNK